VLKTYGALRGRAVGVRVETNDASPHYQVHVLANETHYRLAVNVQSTDQSALLYAAIEAFQHPITDRLAQLASGFTSIQRGPGGPALDYVRGNLVDRASMQVVPANVAGPDNDLNDHLDHGVQRAIRDATAEVYAFGEPWGPEPGTPDRSFGFEPGRGVHDIHMNQGNDPGDAYEDGIWQDGGLFIHFPTESRWVAMFLAFQSQAWQTDDKGHALHAARSTATVAPSVVVQIVAAMVNPAGGAAETESVMLLNASPETVNLDGWAIAFATQRTQALGGSLHAGR
jgi:uncharacterized protein YukJ